MVHYTKLKLLSQFYANDLLKFECAYKLPVYIDLSCIVFYTVL